MYLSQVLRVQTSDLIFVNSSWLLSVPQWKTEENYSLDIEELMSEKIYFDHASSAFPPIYPAGIY